MTTKRGLGISQSVKVKTRSPGFTSGTPRAVIAGVMFDRLQKAQINIMARWPIRTGRSFSSWTLVEGERKGITWVLFNDAEEEGKAYAGYVFRAGERDKGAISGFTQDGTPTAAGKERGGVPFEVFAAVDEINSALVGEGVPEEDPAFAINRRALAVLTQALARAGVLKDVEGVDVAFAIAARDSFNS